MEFEKVIIERKSTRQFSEKKLEKEKLERILEAGRLAPTAKNLQPIKIYVLESKEALQKLDQATPCRYGAQTVLLVCGDHKEAFHKQEKSTYEMDATIVATQMMLEATSLEVDNIWIEMFDAEGLRKEFEIPENLIPVCLLPVGYADEQCPPSPFHKIRKNLSKLVEYK